jgi:hypothetical protein
MSHGLSKSKIVHRIHCPKRLWLEVHQPELAKYSARALQFLQVGNDAHNAYGELVSHGTLIEHHDDLPEALVQTRLSLRESATGAPIFEGAFRHDGELVRTDLIVPNSRLSVGRGQSCRIG